MRAPRTALCELLGFEHPVIAAPMGPDLSSPELVAAVSGAGGLGILQAQLCDRGAFRDQLHRVRRLTDRPFGVNFVLRFPFEDNLAVCLEERVPLISFFWGDPAPWVETIHGAGALVMHQVGSVEAAVRAVAAGVDVVVAQGVEAGGHVEGETSTAALVPAVVAAIGPVPVVAAGGIADARGVAAALALGAQAAALGTRFLATPEAYAHPRYQELVVAAGADATVRTTLFDHGWPNAPHRVLATPFVSACLGNGSGPRAEWPNEETIGHALIGGRKMPLSRFLSFPPNRMATGEIDQMPLFAGQGVGLVTAIRPAAELVAELAAGVARPGVRVARGREVVTGR